MTYRTSYLSAREEDPQIPQAWVADRLRLEVVPDFAEFIRRLRADADPAFPRPPGWVPCTTLWWVEEVEGRPNSWPGSPSGTNSWAPSGRWADTSAIGSAPRPAGAASAPGPSSACLPYAYDLGIDPALVTCDSDNEGSRRIIERGGGQFDNVIGIKRRYWVPTRPTVAHERVGTG